MFEQHHSEETLAIIKAIETQPSSTQRDLCAKVGISLGKTNYIIQQLIKKGFIRVSNFSRSSGKVKKINYFLTPKGFSAKLTLIRHFLRRKEIEYFLLKEDYKKHLAGKGYRR